MSVKLTLQEKLTKSNLIPEGVSLEALLLAKKILVNGKVAYSKSQKVTDESQIYILPKSSKYVSRGGLKLEQALQEFTINVQDKICVDFGASTGGFTDCLLQHGAKKIYAIEKGLYQLDLSLQKNSQVVNLQGRSFFELSSDIFLEPIDLAVCDLSFIPLKKAIFKIFELTKNAPLVALLKPHYEAENLAYLKKGRVKNCTLNQEIITNFQKYLKDQNFILEAFTPCKLQRQGRNLEYLCFIKTKNI